MEGSKGTVVDGVMEKDALWREAGIGEGTGERPVSEISVLEDSAPGEDVVARHPKKELILFAGVFGCLESPDEDRLGESICSGGGRREGRCKAMVVGRLGRNAGDLRMGTNGSLTRRLCRDVPFEN